VSDRRAHTPTDAAQTLIPDRNELCARIARLGNYLTAAFERGWQRARGALALRRPVLRDADWILVQRTRALARSARALDGALERAVQKRAARLAHSGRASSAAHAARPSSRAAPARVRDARCSSSCGVERRLERSRRALQVAARSLEAVSPLGVLARGYSITRGIDGTALAMRRRVAAGDAIETRLARGLVPRASMESSSARGRGAAHDGASTGTWAVVLNWNGGEQNLACVRSLLAQGLAPARIVFVDNASSDGSPARVRAEFPGLVLLQNERNEGYGHGTNRGIAHALGQGAERVLLVNNDVTFEAGALPRARGGAGAGRRHRRAARAARAPARAHLVRRRRAHLPHEPVHDAGPRPARRRRVPRDARRRLRARAARCSRRARCSSASAARGRVLRLPRGRRVLLEGEAGGFPVRVIGALAARHDAHASTGGGYNPLRKYMMAVNTVWLPAPPRTSGRWLGFCVFDVLSLPFVWVYRACAARARGRGQGAGHLGRTARAPGHGRAAAGALGAWLSGAEERSTAFTGRLDARDAWLALAVALAAGLLYALTQQTRYYGDGPGLVSLHVLGGGERYYNVLYLPACDLVQRLLFLEPLAAPRVLSSLAAAVGLGLGYLNLRRTGAERPGALRATALLACASSLWFYATTPEVHTLHFALVQLVAFVTLSAPWGRPALALALVACVFPLLYGSHVAAVTLGPGWVLLVQLARTRAHAPFRWRTLLFVIGPVLFAALVLAMVGACWLRFGNLASFFETQLGQVELHDVAGEAGVRTQQTVWRDEWLVPLGVLVPLALAGFFGLRRRAWLLPATAALVFVRSGSSCGGTCTSAEATSSGAHRS
jgi:hypothetical protein